MMAVVKKVKRLKGTSELVDILVAKLKHCQLVGSSAVAQATLKLLIVVVSKNHWSKINDLLNLVRSTGKRLIEANPAELAVGNIVRRVLHVIREEFRNAGASSKSGDKSSEFQPTPFTTISSMYNLLGETDSDNRSLTLASNNLRSNIILEVRDIGIELEIIYENIKYQATNHIHSNYLGQQLALELSNAGIETSVIPDSAVFAVMSRVNRVILGTHGDKFYDLISSIAMKKQGQIIAHI
ncbi:GCD complex subunit gcd7 [Linnemannia zychae]|nr:GCD complex subunit gcd7 [Linnemannia zychae]